MINTPLLTKVEVSRLLKISTRSIDRFREEGKLRSIKLGGVVRFMENDIKDFIKSRFND